MDFIAGEDNTSEFFYLYAAPPFWIGCGIVILAQILLLLFPISRVKGRQRATKSIWVTIVRRKGECCAPGLTFFGIAAGLAIAALAFGPGLFFLFTRRIRDIKPNTDPETNDKE